MTNSATIGSRFRCDYHSLFALSGGKLPLFWLGGIITDETNALGKIYGISYEPKRIDATKFEWHYLAVDQQNKFDPCWIPESYDSTAKRSAIHDIDGIDDYAGELFRFNTYHLPTFWLGDKVVLPSRGSIEGIINGFTYYCTRNSPAPTWRYLVFFGDIAYNWCDESDIRMSSNE